jgi:hypothetical protein
VSGSYKIKVKSSDPVSEKTFAFTVNSTTNCGSVQAVVAPNLLCSAAASQVSYTLDDAFQAGNVFTAELSNQNGSFTTPTIIGSVTSQSATSIPITLPSNLPFGYYYVRIVASLPSSGTPYTSPISNSIKIGLPIPSLSGSNSVCENSDLYIYASTNDYAPEGQYSFVWKKDGTTVNPQNQETNVYTSEESYKRLFAQISDGGAYSLTVTRNSDGCSVTSIDKTLAINIASSPPNTTPLSVLSGNTAVLAATNCTGTVYWYKNLLVSNNDYLSSNNTYTTPELTLQTTYYAACRQGSGNYCWSTRTPLVVSIDASNAPSPPSISASNNNYCYGSVPNTILTASGCTGIVRWYYKSGTNFYLDETDTQAPYEKTSNPSSNLVYQADCRENGILSTSRSTFEIVVKPVPNSPGFENSYVYINSGSNVSINVYYNYCVGGVVKWFDANTGGNLLFTGRTFAQSNVTSSFQIYANCTLNDCEGSRSSAYVNVNTSITAPLISTATPNLCGSGSTILNAVGCSNGIVNWFTYANSTYSNVGTGQSFTTPTLTYSGSSSSVSFTYYADCTIEANVSSKNSKSINVYQLPTTPSANQPSVSCNSTATLVATNCGNNFYVRWFESSTATSTISDYNNFTTPNLSATTIYYLECWNDYSGTCKSARIPITITVGCTPPDAPIISVSATTACSGSGINLTATGCVNAVNWSDGGIGASRNNVIFNGNLTLTATCNNGLASGNSNSIAITINPKPNLLITNPTAVSPPNTVDITLAAITIGSTLNSAALSYHTDLYGSILLPNPANISVSNTYYIKATTSNSCIDIKPVIVVISDCGTAIVLQSTVNDFNSGTHLKKTNEIITASNVISGNANVTYRSNKSILLSPQTNAGFKADVGSVFKAEIGGCN